MVVAQIKDYHHEQRKQTKIPVLLFYIICKKHYLFGLSGKLTGLARLLTLSSFARPSPSDRPDYYKLFVVVIYFFNLGEKIKPKCDSFSILSFVMFEISSWLYSLNWRRWHFTQTASCGFREYFLGTLQCP